MTLSQNEEGLLQDIYMYIIWLNISHCKCPDKKIHARGVLTVPHPSSEAA